MSMSIEKIPRSTGASVAGDYRVRNVSQRTDSFGRPYYAMTLCDATGEIPGYWWRQAHTRLFEELEAVTVVGRVREHRGRWQVDIFELMPLWDDLEPLANAAQLLPRIICPQPKTVSRLVQVLSTVKNPALKEFINEVLRDRVRAIKYLTASASYHHHHNEAGGLLLHSVECAEYVLRQLTEPSDMRDLAVIGALLHDIGKIETSRETGSAFSWLIPHDAVTLKALEKPLRMLEQAWPAGALALQYCWTWQIHTRRPQYPAMPIAELIRAADRYSVTCDIHRQAFAHVPDYREISKYEVNGSSILCYMPKAYSYGAYGA